VIVLDASVVVAHADPRDAHHQPATTQLAYSGTQPLVVHSIALAEVLVGAVKLGRGAQLWADLQAFGLQLARRDDEEPLRLVTLRATTALKLPDCCVLDVALSNRCQLWTFDWALASAAAARGLVVWPPPRPAP